jgi:hypothetical protein
VTATRADYAYSRFALLAVLALFLVLALLMLVLVGLKRNTHMRTGRAVKWALEVLLALLCLCKALEYAALAAVVSLRLGDVPAFASEALVAQLAAYAGDAQYALIVLAAFLNTPTVPNSKHGLCAFACVLAPALLVALITGALVHFSRVSPLLAPAPGSPFPALIAEVCLVALPAQGDKLAFFRLRGGPSPGQVL